MGTEEHKSQEKSSLANLHEGGESLREHNQGYP